MPVTLGVCVCVCVNTEALSVLPRNSDCSFQSGTLGFLKEACTSSGCHNKISLIVWLKQQELISHNSGGRKSLVKGPPAEGPWRRFCLARRWSPFRSVLAWEVSALLPPLIRAPRCFPEARLSPDTVTLGVRAPTQECRGGTGQPSRSALDPSIHALLTLRILWFYLSSHWSLNPVSPPPTRASSGCQRREAGVTLEENPSWAEFLATREPVHRVGRVLPACTAETGTGQTAPRPKRGGERRAGGAGLSTG